MVLTSLKVQGVIVMLDPGGGGLRVWLVVDEVSTGVDTIILPLLLLAQF